MVQGWEEDGLQPGSALGTEIPQMTRLNVHRVFLSCDILDIQRWAIQGSEGGSIQEKSSKIQAPSSSLLFCSKEGGPMTNGGFHVRS